MISESLHSLTTLSRTTGHAQKLSIVKYPTGDVEITAIKFDMDTRLGNKSNKKRKNDHKSTMDELTLKKSQSRSRKVIRQKALMMQSDRLLTLTFKENITDIKESWKVFKYFNKLMVWRFGDNYQYIAVPEYQKRGAVHFHLAVKGYYPVNTVRRLWLRACGDRGGNIDITNPQKYGAKSWNPKRIVRYLSKYISKQDSVEFNKRRYSSSASIEPPEIIVEWLALGVPVLKVMCDILKTLTHRPLDKIWEIDGYLSVSHVTT
jgi:hypothetical protein